MNFGETVAAVLGIVGAVVILLAVLVAVMWPLWLALAALKYLFQ